MLNTFFFPSKKEGSWHYVLFRTVSRSNLYSGEDVNLVQQRPILFVEDAIILVTMG